jgi:RHH-type proline utilization regulon transcriptional repressor/proline dehydrogenase/delta 1-pyrroline-5-carboxylate dehydrogenase
MGTLGQMTADLDRATVALARRIAELGTGEGSKVFHLSWWSEKMMDWAMARPAFKTQLFRFVDVFPAMTDDADVARHIDEYFEGHDVPTALRAGIGLADRVPLGSRVEANVARRNIERMARQFIVGQSGAEAVEGLRKQWIDGSAFTVDLLGEKTVVPSEADRYAARVHELVTTLADAVVDWPASPGGLLEHDDLGPLPRVNVSIKPTALAPHLAPLTRELGLAEAKDRLRPILRLARARGAFVYFDMEHYDVKALSLELFRDLLGEDEFADLEAGVVVQAYLRDSRDDLADLIAWSGQRARPITVRLVKGAYWDAETVHARAEGWPVPVFEHKAETDANYERCVRLLHDHHGAVRAAFASHNLRSLAYAVTYARYKGIPDEGYEIQMLYGMAEPMHAAIRSLGLRLRVYAPVGELVPGMSYLVRRLLENTSNESFVRHRFAEGRDLNSLLEAPRVDQLPRATDAVRRAATVVDGGGAPDGDRTDAGAGAGTGGGTGGGTGANGAGVAEGGVTPYEPEPLSEWRRASERAEFAVAVDHVAGGLGGDVPALIDGEWVRTSATLPSVDPAAPATLVATSASCGVDEANAAVAAAVRAAEGWRRTPVAERAAVLFRAAEWLRFRRGQIAALQCFEAGKPWDQADGDVCEAIDFCEYYGREMLRLDGAGAALVQSPPGETNRLGYQGKGVTVVIAPWNFPLAIPTGMTVAALVAGNPVILKPAEQTPAVARYLIEALVAGGAPRGVVQFLPGDGEVVGAALVEHPEVAVIAFTGSRAVGLSIVEQAAVTRPGQRHVKRVVAEMGGKNPLIIDADADPDQAVPAAAYSAFGFAGQKCSAASRLIVLDAVYDQVVERLVGATRELVLGHPRQPAVQVGPLIDEDAHKRVLRWVERAPTMGTVRLQRDDIPDQGFFVGPTIVEVPDPRAAIARDEIFGPVLAVLRARDLDEAIGLANDTDYALTAGIFSRSPAAIRRAAAELRAGNVYVNRHITGAVVGRQPFGGYGMSGVGSKAGGPDYLHQFLDPRVVTENTLRQGFAPD